MTEKLEFGDELRRRTIAKDSEAVIQAALEVKKREIQAATARQIREVAAEAARAYPAADIHPNARLLLTPEITGQRRVGGKWLGRLEPVVIKPAVITDGWLIAEDTETTRHVSEDTSMGGDWSYETHVNYGIALLPNGQLNAYRHTGYVDGKRTADSRGLAKDQDLVPEILVDPTISETTLQPTYRKWRERFLSYQDRPAPYTEGEQQILNRGYNNHPELYDKQ